MTELQEDFENHGICIDNVFLFAYLTCDGGQFDVLWDKFGEMSRDGLLSLFGSKLAELIMEDDEDITFHLQTAGGVLIEAHCSYPDPDHVDFAADGEVTGWQCGTGSMKMYVYEPSLDEALAKLVANAKIIEETFLKVARDGFQKGLEES